MACHIYILYPWPWPLPWPWPWPGPAVSVPILAQWLKIAMELRFGLVSDKRLYHPSALAEHGQVNQHIRMERERTRSPRSPKAPESQTHAPTNGCPSGFDDAAKVDNANEKAKVGNGGSATYVDDATGISIHDFIIGDSSHVTPIEWHCPVYVVGSRELACCKCYRVLRLCICKDKCREPPHDTEGQLLPGKLACLTDKDKLDEGQLLPGKVLPGKDGTVRLSLAHPI